jgi:hypothetical protein
MLARPIARCLLSFSAALIAAACSAQVMGAPGTLPNGRHVPLPPGQQSLPETTQQQQTPLQSQPGAPNQAPAPAASAVTAPSLLDKPAQPATVTLDGGKLSVTANNSSLTGILHQLASASGMTIDGLDKDMRVFGTYGPGNPRDILGTLLDGAGYNVMMVGDTASGTPRQLVLTVRNNAPITPEPGHRAVEQDEDQDESVPMNNYPPAGEIEPRPPMPPIEQQQNPNGTPKTPQQILQEIRQQQLQQQQQNPQ